MMNRSNLVPRILILALALGAALVYASCTSAGGMGVGVGYPARWGGGSVGPPVFAGGPAYR